MKSNFDSNDVEKQDYKKQKPEKVKKLKIFTKTGRKIGIFLDSVKAFLIIVLLIVLIIFVGSSIIHNILRIVEASNEYKGPYKSLYPCDDSMMNLYTVGDADRVLIILPEIGSASPLFKYKALADSLSTAFKVVISEPLGYGYSLSTKAPRTSENIVNELREALGNAEIRGPYTLLAFSNSSLYADFYSQEYPEEINGVITVDAVYPESLETEKFKDKYLPNVVSNIKFFSFVGFSGLYRWQSYLDIKKYNIDKMQALEYYGEEEIKLYRNRIANKSLTKEMRREASQLYDNMNDLSKFKFNTNLTTLQVITTKTRDEYLERQENIAKYAKDLITNDKIQKIRTVEGSVDDYLYTKEKIRELKNLINMYF